jgi:hypothetical protein
MSQAGRVQLFIPKVLILFACISTYCAEQSQAQDQTQINGLAYLDYYYTFAAVQDSLEGQNGFQYRRLYLSARHTFSEKITAFARLEATETSIQPFVKDLYLQWAWHPSHNLRFGVVPPPAFQATEEVWDYRSLEKTILDLFGVVSSRDMGIRADGALLGEDRLNYALMFANNNSVRPETYRGKRLYGQLEAHPSERIVLTLGGDYGELPDPETEMYRVSALVGYVSTTLRAGIETFWHRSGTQTSEGAERVVGASVFASGWFTPRWGIVGRIDRVLWEHSDVDGEIYAIAGVAYRPHPSVRFIPNAYLSKQDNLDALDLTGRFTVEFEF